MNGPRVTFWLRQKRANRTSDGGSPPPSRLARQLALAHYIDRLVESGELESYAAAARRLRITRARMAQILSLLNLSAGVQEKILGGEIVSSERRLRSMSREPSWREQ